MESTIPQFHPHLPLPSITQSKVHGQHTWAQADRRLIQSFSTWHGPGAVQARRAEVMHKLGLVATTQWSPHSL